MADLQFYSNINLNKQQVKGQRIENVTAAEETALAGTLGTNDKGLVVFNTTSNTFKIWNGAAFTTTSVAGLLLFSTTVNLTANTPLSITPTGIVRPYQVEVRNSAGEAVFLSVVENNDNTLTLRSNVSVNNLSVRVIGNAA
ncbi:hypothetical protein [Rhodoflexus caldus]|uniref:hypothetical protein n=1 Tax=Rhodoflexus caldus TaxID=2891236 RepID=UPI002029C22A|nr:hypothetical protein [Rhodoflexus caldus]